MTGCSQHRRLLPVRVKQAEESSISSLRNAEARDAIESHRVQLKRLERRARAWPKPWL